PRRPRSGLRRRRSGTRRSLRDPSARRGGPERARIRLRDRERRRPDHREPSEDRHSTPRGRKGAVRRGRRSRVRLRHDRRRARPHSAGGGAGRHRQCRGVAEPWCLRKERTGSDVKILFQGAGAIGVAAAALFTDVHEVAVAGRTPVSGSRAAFPRRVGHLDPDGPAPSETHGGSHGWTVTDVASTRRVAVTDFAGARTEFPAAEVVVVAPLFLSERAEAGAAPSGREVRYWAPIGAPRFLLAGRAAAVRRLARGLGRLALPAPTSAVVLPPTVFIP